MSLSALKLTREVQMALWVGAGLTLAGTLLWKNWDRILARELEKMTKSMNKDIGEQKKALFYKLNELAKAAGPKKLRVLEIGGGTGANFEFIQEPIDWTVLEPNPHCKSYVDAKFEALKEKHLFRDLVQGYAEDLTQFPDNSFDAVVETLVFCSVNQVDKSIHEIHRVLKPSGTFFFLDHVRAPDSMPWRVRFQNLLTYSVWPRLAGNCHLNRPLANQIKSAQVFQEVQTVNFSPKFSKFMMGIDRMVGSMVYGWATK